MIKLSTSIASIGYIRSKDINPLAAVLASYFILCSIVVENLSQPESREREFIVGGCHG